MQFLVKNVKIWLTLIYASATSFTGFLACVFCFCVNQHYVEKNSDLYLECNLFYHTLKLQLQKQLGD